MFIGLHNKCKKPGVTTQEAVERGMWLLIWYVFFSFIFLLLTYTTFIASSTMNTNTRSYV